MTTTPPASYEWPPQALADALEAANDGLPRSVDDQQAAVDALIVPWVEGRFAQFAEQRQALIDLATESMDEAAKALEAVEMHAACLREEVARWRAELVALGALEPDPEPERDEEPDPTDEEATAAPKRSSASSTGRFRCDEAGCDRSFEKSHGLTMHKRRAHKPPQPPQPAPAPTGPSKPGAGLEMLAQGAVADGMLWCDDCDLRFDDAMKIGRHTRVAHARSVTKFERTPKRGDQ